MLQHTRLTKWFLIQISILHDYTCKHICKKCHQNRYHDDMKYYHTSFNTILTVAMFPRLGILLSSLCNGTHQELQDSNPNVCDDLSQGMVAQQKTHDIVNRGMTLRRFRSELVGHKRDFNSIGIRNKNYTFVMFMPKIEQFSSLFDVLNGWQCSWSSHGKYLI